MGDEIGMIMVVLLTALPLYYSMQIATKLTFQQPGVQGEGPARMHPNGRRENSSIVGQYTKKIYTTTSCYYSRFLYYSITT